MDSSGMLAAVFQETEHFSPITQLTETSVHNVIPAAKSTPVSDDRRIASEWPKLLTSL
jgi:hypothetical protein